MAWLAGVLLAIFGRLQLGNPVLGLIGSGCVSSARATNWPQRDVGEGSN